MTSFICYNNNINKKNCFLHKLLAKKEQKKKTKEKYTLKEHTSFTHYYLLLIFYYSFIKLLVFTLKLHFKIYITKF